MTQKEMIEQLEQAYQRIDDALEALNEAQLLTDYGWGHYGLSVRLIKSK